MANLEVEGLKYQSNQAVCVGTYKLQLTLDYLINAHCALIYFQEKSCPVRPYSIVVNRIHREQYYDSPVRLFIFGKIPGPVRLFHTVQLFDSPEYILTP